MAKAPGTIRRRGKGWNVIIRVDGERHEFGPRTERFLTESRSRSEVEEWTWRKYRELEKAARRAAAGIPGKLRFSDLAAEYRRVELPTLNPGGQRSYENSLKIFEIYFVEQQNDPFVQDIRRAQVKAFIAWRRTHRFDKGRGSITSPHTVRRDLRVLNRLFAFAVELEVLEANPCYKIRAPRADERTPVILKPDDYERLLEACVDDPMLHLFVLVLAESGARSISEALRLTWEDVDLTEGFIHINSRPGARTKSGKSRWTPLTARLRAALEEHAVRYRMATYNGRPSPYVFHHTITLKRKRAGEQVRSFRTAFEKAAKHAKLPRGFRPHDLRHRRVTTWLADGGDVVKVKEAVGHASLATTMKYTHLAREHLRSLVERPEGR